MDTEPEEDTPPTPPPDETDSELEKAMKELPKDPDAMLNEIPAVKEEKGEDEAE